mgnify:CR=1 FL=1
MRKILKVSFSPIARMKLRIVSVIIRRIAHIRAPIECKKSKDRFTWAGSPVLINTNNTNKSHNRTYNNSTYNRKNTSPNRSPNPNRINSYSTYTSIHNHMQLYRLKPIFARVFVWRTS